MKLIDFGVSRCDNAAHGRCRIVFQPFSSVLSDRRLSHRPVPSQALTATRLGRSPDPLRNENLHWHAGLPLAPGEEKKARRKHSARSLLLASNLTLLLSARCSKSGCSSLGPPAPRPALPWTSTPEAPALALPTSAETQLSTAAESSRRPLSPAGSHSRSMQTSALATPSPPPPAPPAPHRGRPPCLHAPPHLGGPTRRKRRGRSSPQPRRSVTGASGAPIASRNSVWLLRSTLAVCAELRAMRCRSSGTTAERRTPGLSLSFSSASC